VPVISYLKEDALGSVRVTTNSFGEVKARRDFLPFGEELYAGLAGRNANQKYSASADDTRKKFATYQRDVETGLDFAQSRYYSPMHGRFTSPDEFKGGPDELFDFEEDASDNPTFYADLTNPQSLNKYQYGYNNPYKYNDPSGHCPPVSSCLDKAQEVGDWFGLIPKIGDAVDAVNAGVSLARGDYEGAGRRAIAIIPVVGKKLKGSDLQYCNIILGASSALVDAKKVLILSGGRLGASLAEMSDIFGINASTASHRYDSAKRRMADEHHISESVANVIRQYGIHES
jgi:RHS repeat-associated protein